MRFPILRLASVMVLAFIPASAFSAGSSISLQDGKVIIPASSPVTHATVTPEQEARFDGRFVVTGTLELDYSAGDQMLSFTPDAADASRLPRVTTDPRVGALWFDDKNAAPMVAAAVPPAMQAAVKAQHAKRVSVHVALDIERYSVAIEGCTGEGYYTAHFVSLHAPGAAKIVAVPPRKPGDNEDC